MGGGRLVAALLDLTEADVVDDQERRPSPCLETPPPLAPQTWIEATVGSADPVRPRHDGESEALVSADGEGYSSQVGMRREAAGVFRASRILVILWGGLSAACGGSEADRVRLAAPPGPSAAREAALPIVAAPPTVAALPTASAREIPRNPCPPRKSQAPLTFTVGPGPGVSAGDRLERPTFTTREKALGASVAGIARTLDATLDATFECRGSCDRAGACDVVRNDGHVLSIECDVLGASTSKGFIRTSSLTLERVGDRLESLSFDSLFQPTKKGPIGELRSSFGVEFFALGDNQLLFGANATLSPSIVIIGPAQAAGELACDQVLEADPGVLGGPLSHASHFDDEGGRFPVFHGSEGGRLATATALNTDIRGWRAGLASAGVSPASSTCHVLTSTPELVSVLCLASEWGDRMPFDRSAPAPPMSAGFTYRIKDAKRIGAAKLTTTRKGLGAAVAAKCFSTMVREKEIAKSPALSDAYLEAFALWRTGVLFAIDYPDPNGILIRTKLCNLPYEAVGTTAAALAH